MMSKIKLLCAVMVVILASSVFAACNDTSKQEQTTTDSVPAVDTSNQQNMMQDSLPPVDTTSTTRPEGRKT